MPVSLRDQEQSSGLFTLGVVSYCLGVALVCERLNLSHEVRVTQQHLRYLFLLVSRGRFGADALFRRRFFS